MARNRAIMEGLESASAAMQEVLRIARRVAVSETSLLLLGETGTGKEWLARAIHEASPRSAGPFIAVNCGAIPDSLIESELFGHEKGAFTGAVARRRGYFEQATGGTLFLDEVGEMPAQSQVRLLRALQERTIQRLGAESPVAIDCRVVAATHRDLRAALDDGGFRSDLYFRLAVVTLTMPPLRDRPEDILPLAEGFVDDFRRRLVRPDIEGLSPAVAAALTTYPWPGNVRELINVIERAVLLAEGTTVDLVDLPVEVAAPAAQPVLDIAERLPLDDLEAWLEHPLEVGRLAVVTDFERRYLSRLLEIHGGQVGRTAARAGIDPRTLYNKMRQLGLRKADYRR